MTDERTLSFGQRAVGLTFNPSGDPRVTKIKELVSELIDLCAIARAGTMSQEEVRLWSVAITEAQTAQMWAVKAATWRD